MERKRVIRLFLIFILMIVIPIYAQVALEKTGQAGMAFLSIPVGARASAMGNAFAAVSDNVEAMFWNPAGLGKVSKWDFSGGYTRWIADITYYHAGLAYNVENIGVFGLNLVWVDYGEIRGAIISRDPAGPGYELTDPISPLALVGGLAYGRQLTDRISFGANMKWVYQDLGTSYSQKDSLSPLVAHESKLGIPALDVGVIYFTGFKDLRVAVSVQNVSYEKQFVDEDFSLPFNIRMGIAMDLLTIFAPDGNSSLLVSIDATHPRDYRERLHFGVEYSLFDIFFLRGGYKINYDEDKLSFGIGLNPLSRDGMGIRFDYSFNPFGKLDSPVHRVSVGGSF